MAESAPFAEDLIAVTKMVFVCLAVYVSHTHSAYVSVYMKIQPEPISYGAKNANARLYNKTQKCDYDTGRDEPNRTE